MKTLDELLEQYLDHLRSRNYSPCTIRQTGFTLRRALRWLIFRRVTAVDRLRQRHLREWQRHLSTRRTRQGRPLRPRSVNKRIEVLKGFLRHLGREGLVPMRLEEGIEYVKEPKVLVRDVLTHEQARKMLDSVAMDTSEGYRNRTMLEFLYSTGARAGELLGLDIDAIDFVNRTALVTGKGRKERVVPIGRTAMRFLENYVKAVRPHLAPDLSEKAVFVDGRGRRMPYHTFRRIIRDIAEGQGLETHVTAHTFRRSCATEMLRGGAGMYHVKELLGHESLETLKHYAKLTIVDLKQTHAKCHPRERDGNRGKMTHAD